MGLRVEYNKLIKREKAAEKFFEDKYISDSEKDKWLPKFQSLINEIGKMIPEVEKELDRTMTREEILDGFIFYDNQEAAAAKEM